MTDIHPDYQPIIDHTLAVREWLAAPAHERGYYWTRVDIAWRQVRSAGLSSAYPATPPPPPPACCVLTTN